MWEVAKTQERELKGTTREVERDIANLERDIAKLEGEIKQAGRRGDEAGARIMAKQLLKMKDQRNRMLQVKGQIASSGYAVKSAATQATMGQAMAKTSLAMGAMNRQMNVTGIQKVAQRYEMESTKMEMRNEIVDDVYDSIFEGNEQEESTIMNQIYDEIGLEYSAAAPTAPSKLRQASPEISDEQVEAFIHRHSHNLKE